MRREAAVAVMNAAPTNAGALLLSVGRLGSGRSLAGDLGGAAEIPQPEAAADDGDEDHKGEKDSETGFHAQGLAGITTGWRVTFSPASAETLRSEGLNGRSDRLPAGDFDPLGVDPAVVFGEESGDHEADVIGNAHTTEGGDAGDMIVELRVVADGTTAEIGFDRTRRDGVDGDSATAEFFCEVDGEYFDRAFDSGVDRVAGQGEAGEAGGNVDDASAIGNEREKFLGEKEHAFEMDVHEAVELFLSGLLDRSVDAVTSVVDQMVKGFAVPMFAQGGAEFLRETFEGCNIAGVELNGDSLATDCLNLGNDRSGIFTPAMIGENDIAASASDVGSGVATESTAGSGDQSDFWCGHFSDVGLERPLCIRSIRQMSLPGGPRSLPNSREDRIATE